MPDEADRSLVQRLRILHIEDSEADSLLVQQRLLREGLDCQLDRVETREQFEQALRHAPFDLILADCKLPRFSGLEALTLTKSLHPNIPIVTKWRHRLCFEGSALPSGASSDAGSL